MIVVYNYAFNSKYFLCIFVVAHFILVHQQHVVKCLDQCLKAKFNQGQKIALRYDLSDFFVNVVKCYQFFLKGFFA